MSCWRRRGEHPFFICSSSCFPLHPRSPVQALSRPSFLAFIPSPCTPSFRCCCSPAFLLSPLCLSSRLSLVLSILTSSLPFLLYVLSPHHFCFLVFPLLLFFSHPFLYLFFLLSFISLSSKFLSSSLLSFSIFPCSLVSFHPLFTFSFMSSLSYFLPPSSFPCPLACSISSFYFLPSFHFLLHFPFIFFPLLFISSSDPILVLYTD